jgi:hypothetical protein
MDLTWFNKGMDKEIKFLTPIILANWEAEIRRSTVQSQLRLNVCKTPSQ